MSNELKRIKVVIFNEMGETHFPIIKVGNVFQVKISSKLKKGTSVWLYNDKNNRMAPISGVAKGNLLTIPLNEMMKSCIKAKYYIKGEI